MKSGRCLFSARWEMRLWGFLLSQHHSHSRSGGRRVPLTSWFCRVGNASSFPCSLAAFQTLFITLRQWKIVLSLWVLRPAEPCPALNWEWDRGPQTECKAGAPAGSELARSRLAENASWVWGRRRVVICRNAGEKECACVCEEGQYCVPKRIICSSKFHPPSLKSREDLVSVSKGSLRTKTVALKVSSLIKASKLETFYQQYLAPSSKMLKNENKNKIPNPTDSSLPPPQLWFKKYICRWNMNLYGWGGRERS